MLARRPRRGAPVDRACVVSPCAGPRRVSRLPSYVATSATTQGAIVMFASLLLSLALAFGWGTEAAVGWGTETPAVSR